MAPRQPVRPRHEYHPDAWDAPSEQPLSTAQGSYKGWAEGTPKPPAPFRPRPNLSVLSDEHGALGRLQPPATSTHGDAFQPIPEGYQRVHAIRPKPNAPPFMPPASPQGAASDSRAFGLGSTPNSTYKALFGVPPAGGPGLPAAGVKSMVSRSVADLLTFD